MGCNAMAIAPRRCVKLAGYSKTEQVFRKAGSEVLTYKGAEIRVKGDGPTCLTKPIYRAFCYSFK